MENPFLAVLVVLAGMTVFLLVKYQIFPPSTIKPWYVVAVCPICGGWENFAARHGGIVAHIARPILGYLFLVGLLIVWKDAYNDNR